MYTIYSTPIISLTLSLRILKKEEEEKEEKKEEEIGPIIGMRLNVSIVKIHWEKLEKNDVWGLISYAFSMVVPTQSIFCFETTSLVIEVRWWEWIGVDTV